MSSHLQDVIDALEPLMGDSACVLPCIEAFANLCLTPEQQAGGQAAVVPAAECLQSKCSMRHKCRCVWQPA